MKILIVDDEYSVVESLREYLTLRGYEVLGASRGEEALEILQQEHPDVMLLDIRLPGMSGMEVLHKVRAMDLPVQVIMITGLDDLSIRQEALATGAAGFAFKPLDVQSLERVISAAAGAPPPLAPKSPLKSGQITVLVVDDEPEICVSLRYYLVGLGYKVLVAANGEEALTVLRQTRPRPDIMLLDLSMPKKGGFTVMGELRRMGAQIPTIIMSVNEAGTLQEAALLLGAKRFLQKPVPLPTLERAIRDVLALGSSAVA